MFRSLLHLRHRNATRRGGDHAISDLTAVPIEPVQIRRSRTRRGGPRTPLPLVGLIAIAAGVGVAYVAQVAHATQATYEASQLQRDESQLRTEASRLDDQLARLHATERVVAAAQQLGMRPAGQWAYVASQKVVVIEVPNPKPATQVASGDPLQHFIAVIGGAFGVEASNP